MTCSSTPRRIPTEEIEVGRWYRVEDAVPTDADLRVEEMVSDGSLCSLHAQVLDASNSAWRYNGPVPDSLPPREEKPKRFSVGCYEGKISVFQWGQPYLVDPSSLSLGFTVQEVADLLNAGHEALEGDA